MNATFHPERQLVLDEDAVRSIDSEAAFDAFFELEPEFIFCYTPDLLRSICKKDRQFGEHIAAVLRHQARKTKNGFPAGEAVWSRTEYFKRVGFSRALTDGDWLVKMAAIAAATADYRELVDDDEVSFDAWEKAQQAQEKLAKAEREARLARRQLEAVVVAELSAQADATQVIEPVMDAVAPAKAVAAHTEGWDADEVMTDEELVAGTETAVSVPDAPRDLYLPAVEDGKMLVANIFAGCGLFGIGQGSKRNAWNKDNPRILSKVSGYKEGEITISYEGEELRAGDLETWTKCLLLASRSRSKVGAMAYFSGRGLMLGLGRGTGGPAYARTRAEVARLGAKVHIRASCPEFIAEMAALFPEDPTVQNAKKTGYVEIRTPLLGGTATNGKDWSVEVPRYVRALFGAKIASWFDEAMYYSIRTPTARRLFLLYGAHADCWPLTLAELHVYLGSNAEDPTGSDFRTAMDEAHDELKKKGALHGWTYKTSTRRLNQLAYEVKRREKKVSTAESKKRVPVQY